MKKALALTLVATFLASCGGGSSNSGSVSVSKAEESSAEASSISIDKSGLQIQIGGDIAKFPERLWNPEAALDTMCFLRSSDDKNRYDYTIELEEGDIVLFFFDYSWDEVIDYDGVEWDYESSITDVGSYVSDQFEGEDVSKKKVEIRIQKTATFTFSYFALGKLNNGMKTGMALTGLTK